MASWLVRRPAAMIALAVGLYGCLGALLYDPLLTHSDAARRVVALPAADPLEGLLAYWSLAAGLLVAGLAMPWPQRRGAASVRLGSDIALLGVMLACMNLMAYWIAAGPALWNRPAYPLELASRSPALLNPASQLLPLSILFCVAVAWQAGRSVVRTPAWAVATLGLLTLAATGTRETSLVLAAIAFLWLVGPQFGVPVPARFNRLGPVVLLALALFGLEFFLHTRTASTSHGARGYAQALLQRDWSSDGVLTSELMANLLNGFRSTRAAIERAVIVAEADLLAAVFRTDTELARRLDLGPRFPSPAVSTLYQHGPLGATAAGAVLGGLLQVSSSFALRSIKEGSFVGNISRLCFLSTSMLVAAFLVQYKVTSLAAVIRLWFAISVIVGFSSAAQRAVVKHRPRRRPPLGRPVAT